MRVDLKHRRAELAVLAVVVAALMPGVSASAQRIENPEKIHISREMLESVVDLAALSPADRDDVLAVWGPLHAEFNELRELVDAIDAFRTMRHPLGVYSTMRADFPRMSLVTNIEFPLRVNRLKLLLETLSVKGRADREDLLDVWQSQLVDVLLPIRERGRIGGLMAVPGDAVDIRELIRLTNANADMDTDLIVRHWLRTVCPLQVEKLRRYREYNTLTDELRTLQRNDKVPLARMRREFMQTLIRLGEINAGTYIASREAVADLKSMLDSTEAARIQRLFDWGVLAESIMPASRMATALERDDPTDGYLHELLVHIERFAANRSDLIRKRTTRPEIRQNAEALTALLIDNRRPEYDANDPWDELWDPLIPIVNQHVQQIQAPRSNPWQDQPDYLIGVRLSGSTIPGINDVIDLDLETPLLASALERVDQLGEDVSTMLDSLEGTLESFVVDQIDGQEIRDYEKVDFPALRSQWIARRNLEMQCIDDLRMMLPPDALQQLQWNANRKRAQRGLAKIQISGWPFPEYFVDPVGLLDDVGLRNHLDDALMTDLDTQFLQRLDEMTSVMLDLYVESEELNAIRRPDPSPELAEQYRQWRDEFDQQRVKYNQFIVNFPDTVLGLLPPDAAAIYRDALDHRRYPWTKQPPLVEFVRDHVFWGEIEDGVERETVLHLIASFCDELASQRARIREPLIAHDRTGFLNPNPTRGPRLERTEVAFNEYVRRTLEVIDVIRQQVAAVEAEYVPLDLELLINLNMSNEEAYDNLLASISSPPVLR